MSDFVARYGPWALVAGGAQGIGEAYSRELAQRGLNVAVIDVSEEALATFCPALASEHSVEVLPLHIDLAAPDLTEQVGAALGDRELGLLVYNAGIADVGPFYKAETGIELEHKRLAINVSGPFNLTYELAKPMLARKRGGIILMSSGAGLQGSPYYTHYAATRAYVLVLAESLWAEFKPYHVDVLGVAAGMTLSTAAAGYQHLDTSTFQTTDELVAEVMAALGQQGMLIAGEINRQGREFMKELPRDQLIEMMAGHAITNFLDGEVPEQNI